MHFRRKELMSVDRLPRRAIAVRASRRILLRGRCTWMFAQRLQQMAEQLETLDGRRAAGP
jgi:hypothetical protein